MQWRSRGLNKIKRWEKFAKTNSDQKDAFTQKEKAAFRSLSAASDVRQLCIRCFAATGDTAKKFCDPCWEKEPTRPCDKCGEGFKSNKVNRKTCNNCLYGGQE